MATRKYSIQELNGLMDEAEIHDTKIDCMDNFGAKRLRFALWRIPRSQNFRISVIDSIVFLTRKQHLKTEVTND